MLHSVPKKNPPQKLLLEQFSISTARAMCFNTKTGKLSSAFAGKWKRTIVMNAWISRKMRESCSDELFLKRGELLRAGEVSNSHLAERALCRSVRRSILKSITNVANRLNENWIVRIRLDFTPQSRDAAIHAAISDNHFVSPDAIKYGVASQSPACVPDEKIEQAKLFGGQDQLFVFPEKFMRGAIEPKLTELDSFGVVALATQKSFHARQ
jgi:hypothetical protein